MKKRIVFRADAGKNVGYGHFIRSLALAGYLNDDFECVFTTFNHDGNTPTPYQLGEISKVAQYLPIVADSMGEFDTAFLEELRSDDIVVLDNYYFTTDFQNAIKSIGCKLVSVDDMHDRHFVSDLLISICPDAEDKFDMEPYTRYIGGPEWIFLRPPFLDTPLKHRNRDFVSKIVVAMGGADPYGLTNKLVGILLYINPNLEIHVILGDTVVLKDSFAHMVTVHGRLSAEEIVSLFDSCDMGIFPASTTCLEALSRELHVAGGWYVDNQKELYDYATANRLFYPLGNLLDDYNDLNERLRIALTEGYRTTTLSPYNFGFHRKLMSDIFKNLDKCFLRPVRCSDRDLLYEWANDPDVRANSFNSAPIPYEGHCKWFMKSLEDINVRIYILVDNGMPVGQVRLNLHDTTAQIGYSIDRNHRGSGYGNEIIRQIITIAEKDPMINILEAMVKPDNTSSLKVFERNGFTLVSECSDMIRYIKMTH